MHALHTAYMFILHAEHVLCMHIHAEMHLYKQLHVHTYMYCIHKCIYLNICIYINVTYCFSMFSQWK